MKLSIVAVIVASFSMPVFADYETDNKIEEVRYQASNAESLAWDAKNKADDAFFLAESAVDNGVYLESSISSNSSRISYLEGNVSENNKRFSQLSKRINDVEKKASKGVAGVAAIANIPALSGSKTFSFGMGVGNFNSETAVSAGFQSRVHENVVTKVSFASDGSENVMGAGASFEW